MPQNAHTDIAARLSMIMIKLHIYKCNVSKPVPTKGSTTSDPGLTYSPMIEYNTATLFNHLTFAMFAMMTLRSGSMVVVPIIARVLRLK